MEQVQQILAKCKDLLKVAQERHGVNLGNVQIRFDLKGRCAGQAYRRGGQYGVRFNRDMLTREAFDHVFNDTVPHEIAHLVCFANPMLGKNHDAGWERICRALGGSGARTHEEEVVHGKGNTYEYVTTRGHKVRLGDRHHNAVQRGVVLRYRNNKGEVTNMCSYELVGVNGRTLSKPVQFPAPNAASVVESIVQAALDLPTPTLRVTGLELLPKPTAPVQQPVKKPVQAPVTQVAGSGLKPGSKAAQAREIMLQSKREGWDYEACIARMMQVIGYDRQLARATYKANAPRVGIVI